MQKKILLALAAFMMIFSNWPATAGPPDHAKGKGAPPQKFYWDDVFGAPGSFTFPLFDCGDFIADVTVTFSGFWIVHPENSGRGQFEFYHSAWAARISNSAFPDIHFIDGIPGQIMNRHWTGEAFASDPIETGVQLMVTLPGYGVVFRDVGRIRVDWESVIDPDIPLSVEFTGKWDSFDPDADPDFGAICAALTPPE